MLTFWRFLKSNSRSKIYLHKLNLECLASRGEINVYRAYIRTGAAPVLSTVPSNHGLFTLSLLILSGDISLNPGPLRYPCEICGQPVRKTRSAMCKECSVWFYQACSYIKNFNFKTLEKHPSYVRSCCNCGLTSFSSSMFSSGIVTSNRFDTLSDFPSSSPWNPTGTQATSTYLSRLCFPLHLSSPSHQKTEQKNSDQWTTSSRLTSLFRTNRKSDIRSVNCISLVRHIFMARECRHGLSIQTDNTNCKIRILKRCSRFIAGFFWQSSSARAVQLLGGGGLKLARLRCQGKD